MLSNGNDWLLLSGRPCVALLFAVSAASKFRQEQAEIKALASLHVPAPGTAELIAGICESVGVVALTLGIYVRTASLMLAIFMLAISFLVLSFWSGADPLPVRAQKKSAFFANIAIVGGLLYMVAMGPDVSRLGHSSQVWAPGGLGRSVTTVCVCPSRKSNCCAFWGRPRISSNING
jgi:putative oxidoreductase